MKVAAVQFKTDHSDPDGSRQRLLDLAGRAGEYADLVVLPEMALSGYVFADEAAVAEFAEPADGPTIQALGVVAAQTRSWFVFGYPESAPENAEAPRSEAHAVGRFYNSAAVIDPTGTCVFTYRKTMLYDDDMTWATPGDSGYRVFDTGLPRGRFTVGICMDLNDDAFVDWCVANDVDAIAFPTNWIDEGRSPWGYWAWRLSPTNATLVAANTYGPEAHTGFTGLSAVLAGRTVYAAAPALGDGIIIASLLDIPAEPPEETP